MSEPTTQELVLALRGKMSRAEISRESGITYAKLANLEKGRKPTDTERDAVAELARRLSVGEPNFTESNDTSDPEIVQAPSTEWTSPSTEWTPPDLPVIDETTPPGEVLEEIQWLDGAQSSGIITTDAGMKPSEMKSIDRVIDEDRRSDPDYHREWDRVSEHKAPLNLGLADGELSVSFPLPSPTQLTLVDGVRRYGGSEAWAFKRCRRRWWLSNYRGLRLRYERPVGPKHIGDRLHRALQRWYVPNVTQRTDPRDALERLIVDDWTKLVTYHRATYGENVSPDVAKSFTNDANLERVMLDGYVEWLTETGADSDLEVLGAEEYREVMIMPNVAAIARLDARVRRTTDGARLTLEHKSTGSIPQLTHFLPIDEQHQWQIMVERGQADDDSHVSGTIFNIMRRVKRSARATPPFYQRVEVHRSPLETENFKTRVIGVVSEIERTRERLDNGEDHRLVAYPTPTSDCQWQCPFFAVCGMLDDGSRSEAAIENFYEEGDPYDYYVR